MDSKPSFEAEKAYLDESLQNMNSNNNPIISQFELEKKMEEVLKKLEG
jgi:hypothetical protein